MVDYQHHLQAVVVQMGTLQFLVQLQQLVVAEVQKAADPLVLLVQMVVQVAEVLFQPQEAQEIHLLQLPLRELMEVAEVQVVHLLMEQAVAEVLVLQDRMVHPQQVVQVVMG